MPCIWYAWILYSVSSASGDLGLNFLYNDKHSSIYPLEDWTLLDLPIFHFFGPVRGFRTDWYPCGWRIPCHNNCMCSLSLSLSLSCFHSSSLASRIVYLLMASLFIACKERYEASNCWFCAWCWWAWKSKLPSTGHEADRTVGSWFSHRASKSLSWGSNFGGIGSTHEHCTGNIFDTFQYPYL